MTPSASPSKLSRLPTTKADHNRLPLYFTGTVTVIFLLVGTVLLFQIVNIQNTHIDMEGKQDLLLLKLEANQKEILENQRLFESVAELINTQITENKRMTTINMKNINETNTITKEHILNMTNRLITESNENLIMFDAQNIVVDNMARNVTEINDKLTQLLLEEEDE